MKSNLLPLAKGGRGMFHRKWRAIPKAKLMGHPPAPFTRGRLSVTSI